MPAAAWVGAVFVALDSELHREVALKQILDSHADDPVSRQRFLQEAEITCGLEHPGIVPVYGLGTYGDGRPFYAMRFIKGNSLKEAIERFHADDNRLAYTHLNIGLVQMQTGKPDDALASYGQALAICRKLADENPTVTEFRRSLANTHTSMGWTLMEIGRKDHPEDPSYRLGMGESLLRHGQGRRGEGDLAGAAADWRRADALLEAVAAPPPESVFFHACCHSSLSWAAGQPGSGVSASEADAEAARALALLRRAAALGYRDPATYRNETALDPLRARPDFQLLMMDLAMPPDPFAGGG